MIDPAEPVWLSACGSSACLEVLHQPDGSVLIRNSTDKTVFIAGTAEEWHRLVEAIRGGTVA